MDQLNTNFPKHYIEILKTLNKKELSLLHELRTKYRYGEVTISVQDGTPQFITKTVVKNKL